MKPVHALLGFFSVALCSTSAVAQAQPAQPPSAQPPAREAAAPDAQAPADAPTEPTKGPAPVEVELESTQDAAGAATPNEAPPAAAPPAQSPVPTWTNPPPSEPGAAEPRPHYALPQDQPTRETEPDYSDQPLGAHQDHWVAYIGARTSFVTHSGIDPFAEDNALVAFTLGGGRTVYTVGPYSLAVLAGWDYAGKEATARSIPSSLDVHRFSLIPEGRYHFDKWLYAFARLAPVVVHSRATLEDTLVSSKYQSNDWLFGFDASVGAAAQILGHPDSSRRKARFWLSAEGGYGWTSSTGLEFAPEEESAAPERFQQFDLGDMALRGFMFRVALTLTI